MNSITVSVAVALLALGMLYQAGYLFCVLKYIWSTIKLAMLDEDIPAPVTYQSYFSKLNLESYYEYKVALDFVQFCYGMIGSMTEISNRTKIYGVLIIVSLYMLRTRLSQFWLVKRIFYSFRGIEYESMRSGSPLRNFKVYPSFQVRICEPGLLTDDHNGFGYRDGDYLVTCMHVIEPLVDILLVGPKGKLLVSKDFVRSKFYPDVGYLRLDVDQWARLGVKSASIAPSTPSAGLLVECYGQSGFSRGNLSKWSMNIGKMIYNGSTRPGMSGAPYVSSGLVYGMHEGVQGSFNTGLSAVGLHREVTSVLVSESKQDKGITSPFDKINKIDIRDGNRPEWTDDDLFRLVDSKADSGWTTRDDSFDYNQIVDFGDTTRESTKLMAAYWNAQHLAQPNVFKKPWHEMVGRKESVILGQSDGGEQMVVEMQPNSLLQKVVVVENAVDALGRTFTDYEADIQTEINQLSSVVVGLQEKVAVMEADIAALKYNKLQTDGFKTVQKEKYFYCTHEGCDVKTKTQQSLDLHSPTHVRYPCQYCGVTFRRAIKRDNHAQQSCTLRPKPESVSVTIKQVTDSPSDRVVGELGFRGEQNHSLASKGKNSLNTSSQSTTDAHYSGGIPRQR